VAWFKRYAIGCLIAVFVCAGIDGYKNPHGDIHMGTIMVVSVAWPVFTALVLGSTIGEVWNDHNQAKLKG
jgi:hypothetical protein